jgi:hypothetical protein
VSEQPLVLVINSGSSSLKFAVYALDRRRPLLSGLGDRLGLEGANVSFKDESGKTVRDLKEPTHAAALDAVLEEFTVHGWLGALAAVGHRFDVQVIWKRPSERQLGGLSSVRPLTFDRFRPQSPRDEAGKRIEPPLFQTRTL